MKCALQISFSLQIQSRAVTLGAIPRYEVVDDGHNLAWYTLSMGSFIAAQQAVVKKKAEFLLYPSIHPDRETNHRQTLIYTKKDNS